MNKKDTHNSSVKSNIMDYRESEVDEELAFKYYKKKMGIKDAGDLQDSSMASNPNLDNDEDPDEYGDDNDDDDYSDDEFQVNANPPVRQLLQFLYALVYPINN